VIIPIPTLRGWSRPTVSDTSTWHCFLKINPSPRARFPSSGSDAKRIFHAECLTLRSAVRRRRPEARPSFASRVKTPYNRSFNGKENKARSSIGFPAESEAAPLRSFGWISGALEVRRSRIALRCHETRSDRISVCMKRKRIYGRHCE